MSHYHETPKTTVTTSDSTGSRFFDNHGAGLPTDYTSHNAQLTDATIGRDADAFSTGSTARNFSTARMVDGNHFLEKDFSKHDGFINGYPNQHLDGATDSENALRQIRTANSISISPELFEKLYLSPQNQVKGELRKTFGNPTPIALIGFLMSLMPLSMTLMGWRGAGGGGAANIGWYYFAGGLLMLMGGIGEWILGNTFPFVVFSSFGAFWLGFGATLHPFYNAYGAFADPTVDTSTGLESVGFNVGIGFFLVAMGILCVIYLVCSIRTNLVFFLIFFCLICNFGLLSGAYFEGAKGNTALSGRLTEAAGAFQFVTCLFGWYIFFAIMLASVDFPFGLPIVDLSTIVKGASEKKKINHVE